MSLFDPMEPDLEKAIQIAVRFIGFRPRSELEVKRHLRKKCDEKIIPKVINLLKRYEYINDKNFARLFIENRKKQNPKSKFALQYELKQKGIPSRIQDDLLKNYDDYQMARHALESKRRQWQHLEPEICMKKAMNYLRYRGFGYEVCVLAWEGFLSGIDLPNGRSMK